MVGDMAVQEIMHIPTVKHQHILSILSVVNRGLGCLSLTALCHAADGVPQRRACIASCVADLERGGEVDQSRVMLNTGCARGRVANRMIEREDRYEGGGRRDTEGEEREGETYCLAHVTGRVADGVCDAAERI